VEREGRRRRAAGTAALWREDGIDEEVPPRRRFDLRRRFGEAERRRGRQRALSVASVGGLAGSRRGAPEAPAPPLPPRGRGRRRVRRQRCRCAHSRTVLSRGLPAPLHPTTASTGPNSRRRVGTLRPPTATQTKRTSSQHKSPIQVQRSSPKVAPHHTRSAPQLESRSGSR